LRWNVDVEIVSKILELDFLVWHVDNDGVFLVVVISDTIAIGDLSETENVGDQIGTEPNISPSRKILCFLVGQKHSCIHCQVKHLVGFTNIGNHVRLGCSRLLYWNSCPVEYICE
jgi:hypothetical protein